MPDERTPGDSDIAQRKTDHINLCLDGDVAFRTRTTLLEDVELVHDALPDLDLDEVDLTTTFAGKTLRAPLVIAAMTGGTARATEINRDLAGVAEELGIGFAFGSQRPLLVRGIRDGYEVRDVAPTALVLGNIGIVQAVQTPTARLAEMCASTGVDALCVHLNPAMEVVQPEGDRDFRGGLDTLARLHAELPVPVVVKETGCGLSRAVGQRVAALGITHVDVSGAGGTSWVAVETLRARDDQRAIGELFRDWGIPTAASVAQLDDLGLAIIATGGVTDGLAAARAIALGARCAGIARPFLQAQAQGRAVLRSAVARTIEEIRIAHLLAGARTPDELRARPLLVGPRLARWIPRGGPLARRLLDAG